MTWGAGAGVTGFGGAIGTAGTGTGALAGGGDGASERGAAGALGATVAVALLATGGGTASMALKSRPAERLRTLRNFMIERVTG